MILSQQSPHSWYKFFCPGCNEYHWVNPLTHDITGNIESQPTVYPPIVTKWKNWEMGDKGALKGIGYGLCSCNIVEGTITYSFDTTHKLKGQTVDMVDWKD